MFETLFPLYILLINYFVFSKQFFAAKSYLMHRYFLDERNPNIPHYPVESREKKAKLVVAIGNALLTIVNCLFYFYITSGENYGYTYKNDKIMISALFRNVLNGYYIYDTVNVLRGYKGTVMDKFYLFHHVGTMMCLTYNLRKYHIVTTVFYAEISNLPLYYYKYRLVQFKVKKENKKCTQLKSEMQKLLTLKKVEFAVYGVFRVFFAGYTLFRLFSENKNVPLPFYPMVIVYFCGIYYVQKLWKTLDRLNLKKEISDLREK